MFKKIISKLYKATLLLVTVMTIGIVGFMVISDLSFINALYMVAITMSTVGFGEVAPLTPEARLFTVILIFMSVAIFGYTISVFTEILASGEFIQKLKIRKVQKNIQGLKNHIIVCGFGRNGRQAARKLQLHRRPFVVIDKNPDQRKFDTEFSENAIFLQGNAIEDEVLKKAGIEKAAGIIAALPSDADNLFIVVTARQINKNLKIISRASNSNTVTKLKSAGANNVIMPDKIGGEHMASLLLTPDLVEFMDHIALEGTKNINLLEIYTNRIDASFLGKSIADLEIKNQSGCKVIGYKKQDNTYIINPNDQKTIEPNSCIIVLGKPEQIITLKKFLKF